MTLGPMVRRARGAETRAHWTVRLSFAVQPGTLVERVEIVKTTREQFEMTQSMPGLACMVVTRGAGVVRRTRGAEMREHWTASQHFAVQLGATVEHAEIAKSTWGQLGTVDAMYVVV